MKIQYLSYRQIDKAKWDAGILAAEFPLAYAMSWYLDASTGHQWDALIGGDYEYLMPLPKTAKIPFFPQVYQPVLSQQLGVFGPPVSGPTLLLFLQNIPAIFGRIALPLHAGLPDLSANLPGIRQRTNLVLDLSRPYPDIRAGYAHGLRQRLKKAKSQLKLEESDDIHGFIRFCSDTLGDKLPYTKQDKKKLRDLLQAIKANKAGRIYRVVGLAGQTCAMGLFLIFEDRIINIMNAASGEGRAAAAIHYLFDSMIRKYQGKAALFDFEGSEIPGVRAFFESFGSNNQPYTFYQQGKLPFWLQPIKKVLRRN